jgi:hypothetical protein
MSTSRRLTALAFAAALALAAAAPAEAARPSGRRGTATLERAHAGESPSLTAWLARVWSQLFAMFDEENGGQVPKP